MVHDWDRNVAYDGEAKKAFHRQAKKCLKALASELGFAPGTYDLRSNMGGIAVSGEVTLHHDDIYVQVSKGSGGADRGVMVRTCEGRKDYSGGRNHFAPLSWLDSGDGKLARLCRQVREQKVGFDADAVDDPSYHPVYSTPVFNS